MDLNSIFYCFNFLAYFPLNWRNESISDSLNISHPNKETGPFLSKRICLKAFLWLPLPSLYELDFIQLVLNLRWYNQASRQTHFISKCWELFSRNFPSFTENFIFRYVPPSWRNAIQKHFPFFFFNSGLFFKRWI